MKCLPLIPISILLIGLLFSCGPDQYELAEKSFDKGNYSAAKSYYMMVEEGSEKYNVAQDRLAEIDSIEAVLKEEKRIRDSIRTIEVRVEKRKEIVSKLREKIKTVDDYDIKDGRNDLAGIQVELAVIESWKDLVEHGNSYEEDSIVSLAEDLEKKIKRFQTKAFPQLRKSYGEFAKNKLWEEDIDVKIKGRGYTTIEFIGYPFASNKGIKDFQTQLGDILSNLRFKRVNYKFTKYDDEYTYYDMSTLDDSDL